MTSRCQGLFPPHPFSEGKALGTRLNHFLYPCDENRGNLWWRSRNFQIVTRRLNPYEKSHMSATTENRKFDKNDRFKERKQLRLLLQWLKHRLRKTDDSQDIRNVQKNQTMKLTRTLFAYLLWSDGNCIKTRKLSASWPVLSKLVTLAVCRRDMQKQKKGETRIMVRVRIELTAFALSDHALPAELTDPTR